MRRDTLNLVVDAAALAALLGLAGTGVLNRFVLPPGSRGGHGLALWGLDRHQWGDIHFWLAVALAGLLLIHVWLHWAWVCVVVKRWLRPQDPTTPGRRARVLAGVGTCAVLISLLGGTYLLASEHVTANSGLGRDGAPGRYGAARGGREPRRGPVPAESAEPAEDRAHIPQITGSMTLDEAAATVAMPPDELKSALGLPRSVESAARLGQLRRDYGFEMETVRRVLADWADRPLPTTAPAEASEDQK